MVRASGKRARREEVPSHFEEGQVSGQGHGHEVGVDAKRGIILNSPIGPERGFAFAGYPEYEKYYDLFVRLGWLDFARHPEPPCLDLVHEFYYNLPRSNRENQVKVFKKWVRYDAEAINDVLGIPPLEYEDVLDEMARTETRPDPAEIYSCLTLGKIGNRNPRSGALKIGSMCQEANVWLKFLTGRLFGKKKFGETTIDQQTILFCVLLGRRFDVGRYINEKLIEKKNLIAGDGFRKMTISYPSLITSLCHEVPRTRHMHSSESPMAILKKHVDSTLDEQSVRAFHAEHWSGRGEADWEPPVFGAPVLEQGDGEGEEEEFHGGGEEERDEGPSGTTHGFYGEEEHVWHDARYNNLADRFDAMNMRLDGVENRMDQRFGNVFGRMDEISGRIDGVYGRFDEVRGEIAGMRSDQQAFFERFNAQYFPPPPPPSN